MVSVPSGVGVIVMLKKVIAPSGLVSSAVNCIANLPRSIKESIYIRVNKPTLSRNLVKYNLLHIQDRVPFTIPKLEVNNKHEQQEFHVYNITIVPATRSFVEENITCDTSPPNRIMEENILYRSDEVFL